jgi:hypothetical protein
MSYTAHHRSHHGAGSPEACGSGVWASRDPQAGTSGQAATTTHTRPPACDYPCEADQTQILPPLSACHGAPMPLRATPSDSHPTTRSAETGAAGGTSRAHTGYHARHRIPGLRRAGPQGHGSISVAVPESSPPDPRPHHDELSGQPITAWTRCQ